MDTRAVNVVLGEGEPGILRMVLEAQGFLVVGHARGEEELDPVLAVTHPTVVVLDAGISALVAADVHARTGVPIVVVWPRGTVAAVAEERVDPASVIMELGPAVRRAARHAPAPGEPVRLPDAPAEPVDPAPVTAPEGRPAKGSRGRRVLALTTAWAISLASVAAVAVAVPSTVQKIREAQASRMLMPARPEPSSVETETREGAASRSLVGGGADPCGSGEKGRGLGRGKPDHAGACGSGRGRSDEEHGQGRGRPDEPDDRGNGGVAPDRPSKEEPHEDGDGGAGTDGGGTDDGGDGAKGGQGDGRGGTSGGDEPEGGGGGALEGNPGGADRGANRGRND